MKILFVASQYPPTDSGIAVAAHRITSELVKRGHDLRVVTRNLDDDSPSGFGRAVQDLTNGIVTHRFPEKWYRQAAYSHGISELHHICAGFQPDLVHAYNAITAGYMALASSRRSQIPVVVSCRGDDITNAILTKSSTLRLVLRSADVVTAVSGSLLEWGNIITSYKASRTIFNSIDPSFATSPHEDKNRFRNQFGLSENGVVIGTVAEFRWKKGLDYLEILLKIISERFKGHVDYVLIGRYNEKIETRLRAALTSSGDVGYNRRLIPIANPNRQDLPTILSALDLFLLTSKREGMPNALLEAMSCGTAIAATAVNGTIEIIRRSNSGLLLDPFDPVAGANDLLRLIESSEQLARFAREGKERVQVEFAVENEVNSICDIYTDLMDRNQPGPIRKDR